MSNLITISDVRGYIDKEGTAWLNLEDVARGLGFTQEKGGTEYIRWAAVYQYIGEIGFSQQVGKDGFIPENIFYRLAMKARNETAEAFQAKVADEILPAIRRTGIYRLPDMTPAQLIAAIANQQAEQEQKMLALEARTETVERNLTLVRDTILHRDDSWRDDINRMINKIAKATAGDYRATRNESYDILAERAGCDLNARLRNLRQRMQDRGATKSRLDSLSRMDVIESDRRLKEIYGAIVKEMTIKYVTEAG